MKGNEGYKVRTATCVNCGSVVTKRMPAGRKYCSLECYRAGPRLVRRTGEERACRQCGATFYVPRVRVDRGEGLFCSNACNGEYQGRNKTTHTCKTCGAEFRWSPSRSKANTITYCSIPCRDADPARAVMLAAMNQRLQLGRTTRAELAGYTMLDRLQIPYLRQPTFAGKFTPDAAIPSARLVVQFDGDYWHDRRGTSTEPRILRRVALDCSQDSYIRSCGWDVARFWESDLRADPNGCAERLRQLAHRPLEDAPSRDPLARV